MLTPQLAFPYTPLSRVPIFSIWSHIRVQEDACFKGCLVNQNATYIGFSEPPEIDELIREIIEGPSEVRWRTARTLIRIEDSRKREQLVHKLRHYFYEIKNHEINYRIKLALSMLQSNFGVQDYVLIKGKGAFKRSELEAAGYDPERLTWGSLDPDFYPVIDFHVHPKVPDLKFLADFREAGVTHAVILATDTDPSDVDRPKIRDELKEAYERSGSAHSMPFERLLDQIRGGLYRSTHVTNRDVADWVEDYPHIFIGFGSVNLSKQRAYVEEKLWEIERLKLRGIKLLPFAQFVNPAKNPNMDLLFEYCRRTGTIILSHSGCAAGPFETPELSENARPRLWEDLVKKYPDVTLVLAHFGAYSTHMPGIWHQEAMELGKKYRNVYADLAAVTWILEREDKVEEIRKTIGFDRVLFATDYTLPLFFGITLASVVRDVKTSKILTEEEKHKVLGQNAARLLGIS
jgi:predicted TIM-barrel fold metal-dependent hydrolase